MFQRWNNIFQTFSDCFRASRQIHDQCSFSNTCCCTTEHSSWCNRHTICSHCFRNPRHFTFYNILCCLRHTVSRRKSGSTRSYNQLCYSLICYTSHLICQHLSVIRQKNGMHHFVIVRFQNFLDYRATFIFSLSCISRITGCDNRSFHNSLSSYLGH